MARVSVQLSGNPVVVDLNTAYTAMTTAVTAVGTARTSASEANATVTTQIAAVQTLVTAAAITAPVLVDVNLAVITSVHELQVAFAKIVDQFRSSFGLK